MRFLYKITNEVNGKIYIGQTKDYKHRKWEHLSNKSKTLISKAIQKYGKDNFIFEILNTFPDNKIDDAEKEAIIKYNSLVPNGYNLDSGGCKNKQLCEETKRKMSEVRKGCQPWDKGKKFTIEHRIKISNSKRGSIPWNKGKTNCYSEETIQKIKNARSKQIMKKGRKLSEETIQKIKNARSKQIMKKGYKLSKEVKQKISNTLKGNIPWNKGKTNCYSEKTLKKMSENMQKIYKPKEVKIKKFSEETCLKMSLAHKGKKSPHAGLKHSEETKIKMRLAHAKNKRCY